MERMLYNGVAAGMSLDGGAYFYANPLQVRESHVHEGVEWHWDGSFPWYVSPAPEHACNIRKTWYPCACCPPNVMRLLSSLGHYCATARSDGIQIHHYATGKIEAQLAADRSVSLQLSTQYPWSGVVDVTVLACDDLPWALSLRVPGWCSSASIDSNGASLEAGLANGYVTVHRSWKPGDRFSLNLAMPPRLTRAHLKVDAVRGCVALERGPLVYCFEQIDQPSGVHLDDVTIHPWVTPQLRQDEGPFRGVPILEIEGEVQPTGHGGGKLYDSEHATKLLAIPYSYWANRERNAMRVWMPRTETA
jgi:DUF1680 family protein